MLPVSAVTVGGYFRFRWEGQDPAASSPENHRPGRAVAEVTKLGYLIYPHLLPTAVACGVFASRVTDWMWRPTSIALLLAACDSAPTPADAGPVAALPSVGKLVIEGVTRDGAYVSEFAIRLRLELSADVSLAPSKRPASTDQAALPFVLEVVPQP